MDQLGECGPRRNNARSYAVSVPAGRPTRNYQKVDPAGQAPSPSQVVAAATARLNDASSAGEAGSTTMLTEPADASVSWSFAWAPTPARYSRPAAAARRVA
jgi:hypothetical protein